MPAPPVELLTAADSEDRQRRFAAALARRGVGRGDRIAFVAPGSGDLLSAVLASLRVGVVPVPMDPALLPHERRVVLDDARPALVVDDELLRSLVAGDERADLAPWPLARPMHYTSGTTGRPKGVWTGVLAEDDARVLLAEEADLWGFDRGDLHLVCSPLHHAAPIRFAGGTLLAGGSVVLIGAFDAGRALGVMRDLGPTTAFVVPAHLQRLFAHVDRVGATSLPTASFRLLAHAGAPCPAPLKERAVAAFPTGCVWEFYGSTEGQFTACSSDEWRDRPGTVGRARPGRRLRVDGDGVIWCEVPPHARFTYWEDPEKTAAAWDGDAFTVGDLGRLDGDGYLWLDGRRDDLIISGGVNVYPVEVEQALERLPGVVEVAVFGVEDERWGQRVCAAVVGAVDPDVVLAGARERLAAHKRPKEVVVVDELPRTSTGKVRRLELPAALGRQAAPGSSSA